MKDFLVTLCSILFIAVFVLLIGTAGGIERDTMSLSSGTIATIIEIGILVILAVIIALLSRDEKDVTDVTRL